MPDYSDAYISSAKFEDGTSLDDMELDHLNDTYPELVHELPSEASF